MTKEEARQQFIRSHATITAGYLAYTSHEAEEAWREVLQLVAAREPIYYELAIYILMLPRCSASVGTN